MSQFTKFWKGNVSMDKSHSKSEDENEADVKTEKSAGDKFVPYVRSLQRQGADEDQAFDECVKKYGNQVREISDAIKQVLGKSEDTNKSTNPSVKDLNGSYQIVEDDILDLIYDGEINEAIYKIMDRYNTSPSEAQKVVRQYK